jgi:hypothetical protein
VQFVNILARAQAEAEVMQAYAPLIVRRIPMFGRCIANQHARASANAVEDFAGYVVLDRHAEGFDE